MAYGMDELHAKNPKAAIAYRWVPYEKISGNLKRAMVAAEDAKFFGHEGIDWDAIQVSVEKDLEGPRVGAGDDHAAAREEPVLVAVAHSCASARGLDHAPARRRPAKRRILEIYLNVIEWGDGIYGSEAAARRTSASPRAELSPDEAAGLAAMIPNPRFYERNQGAPGLNRKIGIILARMPSAELP